MALESTRAEITWNASSSSSFFFAYIAKSGERQIDLGGLLETITRGAGLGLSFTAGEVDEMEFALRDTTSLAALDGHGEESVRARTLGVHSSGARGACELEEEEGRRTVLVAVQHDVVHVRGRGDTHTRQTLHVDAHIGTFLEGLFFLLSSP